MSDADFALLRRPMFGMNWEPAPSDYKSLPAPPKYFDTDFANDDFVALWNVDGSGIGRYDLKNIAGLGCNAIKMYNWNPAPKRNHVNFLKMASQLGLGVIVPISNYFTGIAYNNRTNGGNGGGPAANPDLQVLINAIVCEVHKVPGAAIIWAIGNEYDNSNVGAYGYCEAQDIATIASYIALEEARLGIASDKAPLFCSPVTTAITPINNGIPNYGPSYGFPAATAIQDLRLAFTAALGAAVTQRRFVASINSYQTGDQLEKEDANIRATFPGLKYFYGELGWSEASDHQSIRIHGQFTTIRKLAQSGQALLGACCFEYTDELWKGAPGSSETEFGLSSFAGTWKHSHETAAHGGAAYRVDDLQPRNALGAFKQAIHGQ